MADVNVLNVLLYGEPVGTLTRLQGDRTLFAFNDGYIEDPNRPTLGLRFRDQYGELITDFRTYQTKVMPFFSNLLPEGKMRKYLADRAGVKAEREFFLLWALGRDLPGAISVAPADGAQWPDHDDDDDRHGDDDGKPEPLRFSLAGVQLKFSAVGDRHGGLTIPASGAGGSWIVKLPSSEHHGVPENEYSMMTMAAMMGMNVPPIKLVDVADIKNLPDGIERFGDKAFVIERFDRLPDGGLVHIEDFAQVFDVYAEDKYEKASLRVIANVIANECGESDVEEFIRRAIFNALIGNGDMHLKNWSLIYPDRVGAALAPAYDFVSTIPYIPGDTMALNFSRTRDFTKLNEDELKHFAAKAALPEKRVLDICRDTVAAFHEVWAAEKAHLPLSEKVIEAIEKHLKTLPIGR